MTWRWGPADADGRRGVGVLNRRHDVLVHLRQIAHHGAQPRDFTLRIHELMLEVFVFGGGVGQLALQLLNPILLLIGKGLHGLLLLLARLGEGGRAQQKTGRDEARHEPGF